MKKKRKINYPNYACGVPSLHYIQRYIPASLLTYAKKVIGMSATVDDELKEEFAHDAKKYGFDYEVINIGTGAFKFKTTFLKLEDGLSQGDKIEILKSIPIKTFLVESTQKKTESLFWTLRRDGSLDLRLKYYTQSYYKGIESDVEVRTIAENSDESIVMTYANSSICKAVDMPNVNFIIVDCAQFVPNIALNFDDAISDIEQRRLQCEQIKGKITQIIGRVFRSELPRVQGQVVEDPRSIVVLLHNLPYELHDFEPDVNLVYEHKSYSDEELLGLVPRKHKDCIIKSIQEALDGQNVTHKGEAQRDDAKQKAIKLGGVRMLNKRTEYDILTDEDKAEAKEIIKQNKKRDKNSNNK